MLVNHPNIVTIHDVYNVLSCVYVVRELITGGELFDEIIHHNRLPEPYGRDLFRQLVDTVAFCHIQSVNDLDLEPCNVVLTDDHIAKILDVSVAKLRTKYQERDSAVYHAVVSDFEHGNPNYISPEVLSARIKRLFWYQSRCMVHWGPSIRRDAREKGGSEIDNGLRYPVGKGVGRGVMACGSLY